ncbi:MAG: hypothetical protein AAF213_11770 [Pseudomonadota bacterium]
MWKNWWRSKRQDKNHSRTRGSRQQGLTLLEGLLSVGVIAAGLAIVTTLQISQFDYEKAAVTAQQHRIVHYAARRYMRDFLGQMVGETPRGGVTEIPPGLMAAEGYVPDFMIQNGVLRPNPYSQSYRLLVRRTDQPGDTPTLELLTVTTGGKPLSATEAGRIVSIAGAEAGTLSIDGSALTGAYGSWEIPLSALPQEYRLQRGNLAMIAYFRQGGGVYVNSYEVNLPSRVDEYEDLPEDEFGAIGGGGGINRLLGNYQRESRQTGRREAALEPDTGPSFTGSFGRSFNQDLFARRDRGGFTFEPAPSRQAPASPPPQAAPQPAPFQPAPARPAPAPVQSDNTLAAAGANCAPERSLAVSLDNKNQILVCQQRSWQPINLPLALHYGGLNQTGAEVTSQSFPVNQRAFLVAQSAIGPVRGENGMTLSPSAGIRVNGQACQNTAPAPNARQQPGQYRCAMVLQPGQYTISSNDGVGAGQRSFHRLSFVVLPY